MIVRIKPYSHAGPIFGLLLRDNQKPVYRWTMDGMPDTKGCAGGPSARGYTSQWIFEKHGPYDHHVWTQPKT